MKKADSSSSSVPANIDAYIAGFPTDVQKILRQIRDTIHYAAPNAKEAIKYQLPTFAQEGNLVHFGAFAKHIGFYPAPTGMEEFKDELSIYETGKGSVKFPLDQPIPYDLITRIVTYRVAQNLERAKSTKKKKR